MKKIILFISVSFFISRAISQIPNYQFANGAGNTSDDFGTAHCVDNCGNIYVTGSFIGIVDFDPSAAVTNLNSGSTTTADFFVAKYNSHGQFIWAFNVGNSFMSESSRAIEVDNAGNVFVTGYILDNPMGPAPVDFDPGPATAAIQPNQIDAFVAKYNTNGQYQWAFTIKGAYNELAFDLELDASGNIFVYGSFDSYPTDFDPGPSTYSISPWGTKDVFIAKYSSSGTFIAAKNAGGTNGLTDPGEMCIDNANNVYVVGDFSTGLYVGCTTLNNTYPSSGIDGFLIKYDNSLNCLSAFNFGSNVVNSQDQLFHVQTDNSGNIYVSGEFSTNADLQPGPGTYTIAGNAWNGFVAKYNSSFQVQWAFPTDVNVGVNNSLKLDLSGDLYIAGAFTGTADIDPGATVNNLVSNGNYDIFVAKYNSLGSYQWAFNVGSVNFDFPYMIGYDPNYGLSLTGYYGGSADFDPSVTTNSLTNAGNKDIFIANYTLTPIPSNISASSSNSLICVGQTATLNATGAITYTWSTSATGSVIAVSPTITTNYNVSTTSTLGCLYTAVIIQSVSGCTGISTLSNEQNGIQVFPNPTNGELSVLINSLNKDQFAEIYNTLGQIIKREPLINLQTKINLSEQPNGIYFVKVIENGNAVYYSKIVKQ